jgi:hypothetical protein
MFGMCWGSEVMPAAMGALTWEGLTCGSGVWCSRVRLLWRPPADAARASSSTSLIRPVTKSKTLTT